jgi:uncharacterized protein
MPVRSLNSPVFKWPDREFVHQALLEWVEQKAKEKPELLRAGYFGSYARGDWGVGSDLDLILILDQSPVGFYQRATEWDATSLPVPVDILVYTEDEWKALASRGDRFQKLVEAEAIWVLDKRPGLSLR